MHSDYQRQGLILSVGLHATVLTIVAVLAWWQPLRHKETHVFELIPRGTAHGDPNDTSGRIGFDLAEPAVAPPVTPLRTPPPPAPRPQPQPQTRPPPPQPRVQETPRLPPPKPVTKPPPSANVVTAPKPAPPKPATQEKISYQDLKPAPQEKISYQDFIKEHGKPKANAPRAANTNTRKSSAPVPRLDTKFSAGIAEAVGGRGSLGSRTGSTDAVRNEVTLYLARLQEAIKEAWDKPNIVLSMSVDFDIEPSGRLVIVRIAKSSGNAAFDESVLNAFRKVGSIGPTPGRVRLERTWNFHTRED